MFIEYLMMMKYFFVCLLFSIFLCLLSTIIVMWTPNVEKISMYECGFNPFSDSSMKVQMHFYMMAILFMIFDLEMVFLFPWVILLNLLNYIGFISMLMFLFMLLMGFIYEWLKGALNFL